MSLDDGFERPFENLEPTTWGVLREIARANNDYFSLYQDDNSLRISAALTAILNTLDELRPLYKEISEIAPKYDFDDKTPGNGYRSFLYLIDKSILHTGDVCRQVYMQKDAVLFRKSHYMKEVEACSQLTASLSTFFHHLKTLHEWRDAEIDGKPSLFPSDRHNTQDLISYAEHLDQYCFYGRCLAFQFPDSLKAALKTILVSMVAFSETYYTNKTSVLGRCANSVKYLVDPEARARRIVNISQHSDIFFIKAFWYLNETHFAQFLPLMMTPTLSINQVISIPPDDLIISGVNGNDVIIPIPCSHVGKKPIHVKLYSAKRRIGMIGSAKAGGDLHGPSDVLLFHCHGGGFVSHSPKSHEIYLRSWAVSLDQPILSIDYSHAPEAPYPRAIEEIVYSYAWAHKHADSLLGTNAKKVILIGDSAGANLNLALATRCHELGIRKPDGIFMVYTPTLMEFIPSPSRMLGITDPLLPFGFMVRCLKAYTLGDPNIKQKYKDNETGESPESDNESFAEVSESDLIALALSPNGGDDDDDNANENKMASLPSDSTLNSVSLGDPDVPIQASDNTKDEKPSKEYFRKFFDIYKNTTFKTPGFLASSQSQSECSKSEGESSSGFFGFTFGKDGQKTKQLDLLDVKSPSDDFVFTVPRDPLLSPYRTPDDILRRLPTTKILTTDFDPCLDDCVMFARKLRALGVDVTLDILPGLPHGFLHLCMWCKEAHEGAEKCMQLIKELIDM